MNIRMLLLLGFFSFVTSSGRYTNCKECETLSVTHHSSMRDIASGDYRLVFNSFYGRRAWFNLAKNMVIHMNVQDFTDTWYIGRLWYTPDTRQYNHVLPGRGK